MNGVGVHVIFSAQRICIASPKTLNIKAVGEALGFRYIESHFAYVHRSLTRDLQYSKRCI